MGLYSPVLAPTYVATLRLSLDQAAWARVVAASGGLRTLLQSQSFLFPMAPADPDIRDAPLYRWQYEGEIYLAMRKQGLVFRPGALYLGLVASPPLARVRLVDPGQYAFLNLPDLTNATLAPFVAACNLLVQPPVGVPA